MYKNILRLLTPRCTSCLNQQIRTYKTQLSDERVEFLSQVLDIPRVSADYMCARYPMLIRLREPNLKSVIDTVTNLGLNRELLVESPVVFSIKPLTLKHRCQVLQECGLHTITGYHISNFLNIIKTRTIGDLKKDGILSETNIENRLASYFTQWPTSLTTSIQCDVNKLTLYNLRLKIIQSYLEFTIHLTQEEFDKGLYTYPTIKLRPLQMISTTIPLLLDVINMPESKIKSNLYLIHANSENLKHSIYDVKTIAGVDIKDVLRMYPKLCLTKVENLVEIKQIFEEYGISDEAQLKCLNIYTLSPKTIKERLKNIKEVPEFQVYRNHPRFLKIVMYNKNALRRVIDMYKISKRCLSLNCLSGCDNDFQKFVNAPGDRSGKGKDLLYCITYELGKGYSVTDVRKKIKRHPFWINIPLVHVRLMFYKLITDFSKNDIYENCTILLYPIQNVKEAIKIVENNDSSKLYMSPPFLEHVDTTKLTKSQILSLVLYMLEKDHYFSGNGVWIDEKSVNNIELNKISESN